MDVMSTPSRQKSWQTSRERVSVLAALAIQKETVSRVLVELREQHKPPGSQKPLSQEKAAARAGVTGRQWQRWESGKSEPYLRNLEAVASAFDIPVSRFIDVSEQEGTTSSLDQVEAIAAEFRPITELIVAEVKRNRLEIEQQNQLLERQSKLLAKIEAAIKILDAVQQLGQAPAEEAELLHDALPPPETGEDRRAGSDRRHRTG